MLAALFMVAAVDTADTVYLPPRPAQEAVVAAPAPTYNGTPLPEDATQGVAVVTADGFVTVTGPAEAAAIAAAPAEETQEEYDLRMCLRLQETINQVDWDCESY